MCRAAAIALTGVQGTAIMVEAAVSQQLPGMTIIGLPDTALAEAKLRVRSATTQAGLPLSNRFITVNLSPAALPKHGAGFDLAIALAALAASRRLPPERLSETAHLGELALGGELRRPAGLLSSTVAARRLGFRRVMVPAECAAEAALVPGIEVVPVADLGEAVGWYRGGGNSLQLQRSHLEPSRPQSSHPRGSHPQEPGREPGPHLEALVLPGESGDRAEDMSEIIGQPEAVEALVIAAAGRHHLSLLGPPGVVT